MTDPTDRQREDLPELTPAMFHILLALADGPRHGYAVMQEVEESSYGEIRLPPGTLYRSIKRLLGSGLIEEVEGAGDAEEDARRRYYGMTTAGRDLAAAEARRLADIVGRARSKNLLEGRGRG